MLLTAFLLAALTWAGAVLDAAAPPCNRLMFQSNVDGCRAAFNSSVARSGFEERCPWPAVSSVYAKLKRCVDHWAVSSWCKGHGFLVDDVFLAVHQTYFSLCGHVHDPPLTVLLMLTLPAVVATVVIPLLYIRIVRRT